MLISAVFPLSSGSNEKYFQTAPLLFAFLSKTSHLGSALASFNELMLKENTANEMSDEKTAPRMSERR